MDEFNPLKITAVTVTWEVENIWNLSFDGASSASFMLSDHIFHLFIRKYELSIAVYLCRDDAIPGVLPLLCRLCIVDQIGQDKLIGEKEKMMEKGKEIVLIDSISVQELERQKVEYLVNDSLVIKCDISASYRRNLISTDETGGEKTITCFETLSSDFENLYNSQKNSDALLKVEETEFPVHKTVLCARCPVMASMLGQESRDKPVIVADIKSSVFRDVLHYIYSGKVRKLTTDKVAPILLAANRFSLPELADTCRQVLQSNLTDDNIFDTAVLAHETGDLSLKEEVEKYIVANLTTILESEKWRNFCEERYKFANEILTTVLLRLKGNIEENQKT